MKIEYVTREEIEDALAGYFDSLSEKARRACIEFTFMHPEDGKVKLIYDEKASSDTFEERVPE